MSTSVSLQNYDFLHIGVLFTFVEADRQELTCTENGDRRIVRILTT